MARFSIDTKNGRMRATSEDGENVTLYLWDSPGFSAELASHVVTVKLADLRQVVSHFEWLEGKDDDARKEQTQHTGITVNIDTDELAAALAKPIAEQIAKSLRTRGGRL